MPEEKTITTAVETAKEQVTEVKPITTEVVKEEVKVEKSVSRVDQLKLEVDKKLKFEAPTDIFSKIVEIRVEDRKKVLLDLVLEGLKKRESLQEEYKKTDKPDQQFFDSNGKVVQSFYSQDKSKKMTELRNKLESLSKALETFLENGDANPLEKALKSNQDQSQQPAK